MNDLAQAIIILNRRKKQVLEELEKAQPKLLIWSKRVKSSKENNQIDLLREACLQENLYIKKVKSLESQLSQLSAEIDKYEKRQSDLALSAFERMKTNILEIEEKKDKSKDFSREEELDTEEEIKLIKNFLKCATSALEKLESKVLKYKENKKSFNIINVDDELEELRKQLKGT